MSNKNIEKSQILTQDIKELIHVVRAVDSERVRLYWSTGERIAEEGIRYGKQLTRNLSKDCGVFSNTNALRSKLDWTQYKLLVRIVIMLKYTTKDKGRICL